MKKITIQLESDLLCATGESTAFVDANPVFDQYGLPYIKGKTFKGLLKEAALEVCEITGEPNDMVDELFGTDKLTGLIHVGNIKIEDHDRICKQLKMNHIGINDCSTFLTVKRRQTSIDDGVADDGSLRTYHLIKHGIVRFETIIRYPEAYNTLMYRTFLQLRFIGTRRNRGFGKISIRESALENKPEINPILFQESKTDAGKKYKLKFRVSAIAPLHISRPVGDQNTEGTEDFIPGSAIRGILAKHLINTEKLGSKAHENDLFRKLILGEILYSNAYICQDEKVSQPMPMAIGYDKTLPEEKRRPVNILENDLQSIKTYSGWAVDIFEPGENMKVGLTQHFHNRRGDRLAGKSTETDGAIFYYESIEEGQEFEGLISGPKESLEFIRAILESGNHAIGGSKATQYGNVMIQCEDPMPQTDVNPTETSVTYYMVLQSHCILYNELGFSEPVPEVLNNNLAEAGLELSDQNAAARVVKLEGFYTPWNSRTDLEYAYSMGSTFKVKITNPEKLQAKGLMIGERNNEGFGQFRLYDRLTREKGGDPKTSNPGKRTDPVKLPGSFAGLHEVTRKILEYTREKQHREEIRLLAIKKAKNLKTGDKINNHHISRLKRRLQLTGAFEKAIKEWSDALKTKEPTPLEKVLYIDLGRCWIFDKEKWNIKEFREYKTLWLNVMDYLRQKSKRNQFIKHER